GLYLALLLLGGVLMSNDELPNSLGNIAKVLPSSLLSNLLRASFNDNTVALADVIFLGSWAVAACACAVFSFRWSD
ncbi:MAG: ABC transporter permease, partial [Actinobacteria bacterium]|nr:ABC transporter permease [Actinomycetota bacterium]